LLDPLLTRRFYANVAAAAGIDRCVAEQFDAAEVITLSRDEGEGTPDRLMDAQQN
jgi:hypothetical protein